MDRVSLHMIVRAVYFTIIQVEVVSKKKKKKIFADNEISFWQVAIDDFPTVNEDLRK